MSDMLRGTVLTVMFVFTIATIAGAFHAEETNTLKLVIGTVLASLFLNLYRDWGKE